MDIEKELGKKILQIYNRTIFGKLSKVEIDLTVFGMLVKETFKNDPSIYADQNFNWFRIDSRHIRQLSFKFQITERRVSTLLEQSALLDVKHKENDKFLIKEIVFLIGKYQQEKTDINEGKLRLYIPNNITKTAIESFLSEHNGIPDTSYSQKILTIRLVDLLACFSGHKPVDLLLDIAKKSNQDSKTKEMTAILNQANSKTAKEKLMIMASSTLQLFLGAGGDFMVEEFSRALTTIID